MDNGFITQMKDKNGDMWYHQVVIDTINENKDKMYQKLLLYSNELEDRIEKRDKIINELEKFIDEEYRYYNKRNYPTFGACMGALNRVKNKLQELKGVDKE